MVGAAINANSAYSGFTVDANGDITVGTSGLYYYVFTAQLGTTILLNPPTFAVEVNGIQDNTFSVSGILSLAMPLTGNGILNLSAGSIVNVVCTADCISTANTPTFFMLPLGATVPDSADVPSSLVTRALIAGTNNSSSLTATAPVSQLSATGGTTTAVIDAATTAGASATNQPTAFLSRAEIPGNANGASGNFDQVIEGSESLLETANVPSDVDTVMPSVCTASNLFAAAHSTSTGNPAIAYTLTLWQNGSATALAATIDAAAGSATTTGANATNTISVSPGDLLEWHINESGSPSKTSMTIAFQCQ
jgi:hypothetical protein